MADYFDYNDSVRTFLVSMSLDTIDKGLEGTTVGYGIELRYSGSDADKSLDGAYALWDEDIQFTGTASLFLTIPTASYLDSGSAISSSIATFISDYTRVSLSGSGNDSLDTQILLEAGSPTAMACDSSCYQGELPWYWAGAGPYSATIQSPTNRNRRRPIKGGISITSTSHSTPFAAAGSVGTMGLVCQDTATNALVGLTNNHVVIRDSFYTNERTYTNPQNEFDLVDGNGGNTPPSSYTELVYQSGEFTAQPVTSTDNIGRVIRYVPLYSTTTTAATPVKINRVDGAIFSIYCSGSDNVGVANSSSWQQHGLPYLPAMPFASAAEINNLLATNPELYSSGRSTGVKGSPTTLCPIRFFGYFAGPVSYPLQGVSTPAVFVDLLKFVKPFNSASYTPPVAGGSATVCPFPIWAGDSGSTLIANFSGTWKVIGLNFAGDGCPAPGVCAPAGTIIASSMGLSCRIDNVASELGVKAWTTPWTPLHPVTIVDDIKYITTSGSNDTKTLACSGSTYWQVGLTTHHNNC